MIYAADSVVSLLLRKKTMSLREAKHKKFALFCTPYYLRHGIEIFSDNSLPLDANVLFWKLKKKKQDAVTLIFKVSHSNRKCAAIVKFYCHKLDKSSSIEFCLSCSDKIK